MATLNDFNWQVNLFLKNLNCFQRNVNKTNKTTITLLANLLTKVDEIITGAENDESENENAFFQIDEKTFEFQPLITCRICHLQIGVTHKEYVYHATSERHNRMLIAHNNEMYRIAQAGITAIDGVATPITPFPLVNQNNRPAVPVVNRSPEIHSPPIDNRSDADRSRPSPPSYTRAKSDLTSHTLNNRIPNRNSSERQPEPKNYVPNRVQSGKDYYRHMNNNNHNNNHNNNNNSNYGQDRQQPLGSKNASPRAEPPAQPAPNVFDDDIYSFIDGQNNRSQPNSARPQQRSQNQPQRRNSEGQSAEIKPVPPYMLNSLYQKSRYGNKSASTQNTTNNAPAKPPATNAQLNDDKLKNLIENLKAKNRSQSVNNLNTMGRGNSSDMSCGEGSLNGSRSNLSVSSLNNNRPSQFRTRASSINESKGAIPKRSSQNQPIMKTADEYFKEFFIRDISPIVCQMLEEGVRLQELPIYTEIINEIENEMRQHYPTVKCHLYGSRITGVANNRSSLDIYADLLDSFNTSKSSGVLLDAAEKILKALKKSTVWSCVNLNKSARKGMTIVAKHESSQIECNISVGIFGLGIAVHTANFIQAFFKLQPVCRQAAIWITLWFRGLPSKQMDTFSGYLITLLVIFFFQAQNRLPSVKDLQEGCQKVRCGENSVQFNPPQNYEIWSERFRNILIGFFEFYSKFDFKESIISVYEGEEINQSIRKQNDADLSNSLQRFKKFVIQFEKSWRASKLCVQDVFVNQFNVAEDIHEADVLRFQNYCRESLAILLSPAAENVKY